jgi:alpha-galactosidase
MKKFNLLSCFVLILYSGIISQSVHLAPTPPMGWNSWNFFEAEVSEQIIKEIADALVQKGMLDAGYQYIIIDDFWVGGRDKENR